MMNTPTLAEKVPTPTFCVAYGERPASPAGPAQISPRAAPKAALTTPVWTHRRRA